MDRLDKADKARNQRRASGVLGTLGSAFMALFMLGAITFGANYIRPMTADLAASKDQAASEEETSSSEPAHEATEPDGTDDYGFRFEPTPKPAEEHPDATPKPDDDKPEATPTPKPAEKHPDATPKPTQKPTEKPAPDTTPLSLEAWVKEGKVKLAWSKFGGDGFAYYKVVRSKDVTVGWPLTWGDELVAAISDRYSPWAVDAAPCGIEFHYRVFAVRHTDDGYAVLAASNVVGAFVPCAEPAPDPTHMALELTPTDAGVKLAWNECPSDGFVYYKVVRSATNESPMYPLNDGTELLAAIGDPGVTTFADGGVEPGQTWFYRVLCFAMHGDDKVLVGISDALSITVE